jgi:glyoxylase-like metal-dependent hydrolase (beta-lactamase superfamily II)
MAKPPAQQIPAVYHRRVGDVIITALSDGQLFRDHTMMIGISEEAGKAHMAAGSRKGFVLDVNAFVVFNGDRVALIETGSGDYLGDQAGHLMANLKVSGIAPSAIDTILLTHMHPDHSAGLTDLKTGRAHYPNAELVVHENEPKHWFDDAAMARGTEREKKLMFQQAREQCAPYLNRMRTFTQGDVFPGITAIPIHGHTPGHSAFLIESAGERLLIWGDAVHFPEVQVPRPEVSMVVDVDPTAAAASRKRMFDMAAQERIPVTGMHMHFPGFGHITKDGAAYRFMPDHWHQSL